MYVVINEKLPKLQELVMSGQQPCSAVCAQALRQCHRLLNEAETKMDQAIQAANQAAIDAHCPRSVPGVASGSSSS